MPEARLRPNAVLVALLSAGLLGSTAARAEFPGLSGISLLSGPAVGWKLSPSLDVYTRWTDNAQLIGSGGQSDYELRIVPGVSFSGRSGRISGAAQFSWENAFYARDKAQSHNSLLGGASGTLDLYERKLLVDAALSMTRQRNSVFGTPVSTGIYDSSTQSDMHTYTVSPYYLIQGATGLDGELRYRYTYTDSDGDVLSNNRQQDVSFVIGSDQAMPLGWTFTAAYSTIDYEEAKGSYNAISRLTGKYALDPLFRLLLIGGYERNNYVSTVGQDQVIYGGGFEWTPSPRTRLYAEAQKRFFGTGYDVELSWRGPRSGISGRFTRDVTTSSNTLDANALVNLYLSYVLSISKDVTDPIQLLQMANKAWQDRGLPGTIGQGTSYVSQAYFLEQRSELAGSWNGARNTLTVSLYQSKHSRLTDAALLAPTDDLATFDNTNEIGGLLSATHALSPRTSLLFGFNASKSTGDGASNSLSTRWRTTSLSATTTLGPHTTGGLIYQYNVGRGGTEYVENSITANVGMRF